MKKLKLLSTILIAFCGFSFAQSVSFTAPDDGSSLDTKSSVALEISRDASGLPAEMGDTVSFQVFPKHLGEIIGADDNQSATFYSYGKTGTANLVVRFRDSVAIADTIQIIITGENQTEFYVALDGSSDGFATEDNPTSDISRAIRFAIDGDVIHFAAGEYTMTETMVIAEDVHLSGAGSDATIFKAHNSFDEAMNAYATNNGQEGNTGFKFVSMKDTTTLTVSGMAIKYYHSYSTGCVFAPTKELKLNNVIVTECIAQQGVAINAARECKVEAINCKFNGNHAIVYEGNKNGGCINMNGSRSLHLENCEIIGTVSQNDPTGNGKYNDYCGVNCAMKKDQETLAFDLVIKNTTIANNTIQDNNGNLEVIDGYKGGGIGGLNIIAPKNPDFFANILIENSTFTGNKGITAGGIRLHAPNETDKAKIKFDLINNTIANNICLSDSGGGAGGVYFFHSGATINVVNNIIVDNTNGEFQFDMSANARFLDFSGGPAIYDMYNNLCEKVNTRHITKFEGINGNVSGEQNGLLESDLADNGGTVRTLALLDGSAAINAGLASSDAVTIPTKDARGYDRDDSPDLGAYEHGASGGGPSAIKAKLNTINVIAYPNPCNSLLNIELENNGLNDVNLLNLAGQILYNQAVNNSTFTIDMSKFKTGMYVLTITNSKGKNSQLINVQ